MAPRSRLAIFLGATFAVSWSAWGVLLPMARARTMAYGQLPFMCLYMLGGLGPTIGAYAAVLATPAHAPLSEFHGRLVRRPHAPSWYAVAVGLPFVPATASMAVAALLSLGPSGTVPVRPWFLFPLLFAVMVVGGGLEELGWRGVAQPELEPRLGRPGAALVIGIVWAAWHLPLFLLPGVRQYGTSFPVFALGVIGAALILAWLYGHTRSILLCIVFHASSNAVAALGLTVPPHRGGLALLGASITAALGSLLLLWDALAGERRT